MRKGVLGVAVAFIFFLNHQKERYRNVCLAHEQFYKAVATLGLPSSPKAEGVLSPQSFWHEKTAPHNYKVMISIEINEKH